MVSGIFGNPGTRRHHSNWENWARTLESNPSGLFRPRSEDDVIEIVKRAAKEGKRVRAAGSGHSWSPLVPTDGYIIVSEHLTAPVAPHSMIDATGDDVVVRVGPGLTQGRLQRITEPAGLAFSTLGVVYDIQLGGFVVNGCHGTGWDQPTVSDLVHSLRVVMADGSVREFSEDDDLEAMNFARVNLGSIGFVTEIGFNTVPLFNAHAVDETAAMNEVIPRDDGSRIAELVTSDENPYVELFWFPFNTEGEVEGEIWFKHYRPTEEPPNNKTPSHVWDRIESEFAAAPYYAASFLPETVPELMPRLWKLVPDRDDYIAPVPDVFHYQHYAYSVTDVSFAIPIRDNDFGPVVKAWYAAVDGIAAQAKAGKYPVNVTLHARFLKNSQALLSPAYEPEGSDVHYCFIEVVTFQPRHIETQSPGVRQFEEFVADLGPKWMALGGRPHWAKAFQDIPGVFAHIRESYGDNLSRWLDWRDGLDPKRMFWNGFMEKIFNESSG